MDTPATNGAWRTRVVCEPDIRHGSPTIRGTRVAVSTIVANLADMGFDELLRQYPQLKPEDVRAALLYAAESAHNTLAA